MNWLKHVNETYEVIMTPDKVVEYGDAINAVPSFAYYKEFYCYKYFDLMYKVLSDSFFKHLYRIVPTFLALLSTTQLCDSINY